MKKIESVYTIYGGKSRIKSKKINQELQKIISIKHNKIIINPLYLISI